MSIDHCFEVRLFTFFGHLGQVEDTWVDFKLVDELALLMYEFLFKVALFGVVELLRAEKEASGVYGAEHGLGFCHFALASILNDRACYFFVAFVPFAERMVDILGK